MALKSNLKQTCFLDFCSDQLKRNFEDVKVICDQNCAVKSLDSKQSQAVWLISTLFLLKYCTQNELLFT